MTTTDYQRAQWFGYDDDPDLDFERYSKQLDEEPEADDNEEEE